MIYIILIVFCGCFFALSLYSKKFYNPYNIDMVFSRPGGGKTTFLVREALKMQKKGWRVYTTSEDIPGEFIHPSRIGTFYFTGEKNLLIIDEIATIWHSRDFKNNFSKMQRNWFKYHRHQKLKILIASQSYDDVDKVVKLLTTDYYLLVKYMNIFVCCKKIKKSVALTEPVGDSPGSISDSFEFEPFFVPGARRWFFLPAWVGKFNSFSELPGLPYIDDLDDLKTPFVDNKK